MLLTLSANESGRRHGLSGNHGMHFSRSSSKLLRGPPITRNIHITGLYSVTVGRILSRELALCTALDYGSFYTRHEFQGAESNIRLYVQQALDGSLVLG